MLLVVPGSEYSQEQGPKRRELIHHFLHRDHLKTKEGSRTKATSMAKNLGEKGNQQKIDEAEGKSPGMRMRRWRDSLPLV